MGMRNKNHNVVGCFVFFYIVGLTTQEECCEFESPF